MQAGGKSESLGNNLIAYSVLVICLMPRIHISYSFQVDTVSSSIHNTSSGNILVLILLSSLSLYTWSVSGEPRQTHYSVTETPTLFPGVRLPPTTSVPFSYSPQGRRRIP